MKAKKSLWIKYYCAECSQEIRCFPVGGLLIRYTCADCIKKKYGKAYLKKVREL